MKRCLAVGVFDLFHYGHLRLFKQIKQKEKNSKLIVAIQKDAFVFKYKPQIKLFYNENQRKEILNSIKEIDELIFYTEVNEIVKEVEFDIFCVGEDQVHKGFEEAILYCKSKNKKILRIKRTPHISSSDIREYLNHQKYNSNEIWG